jgi:hypothetical protein
MSNSLSPCAGSSYLLLDIPEMSGIQAVHRFLFMPIDRSKPEEKPVVYRCDTCSRQYTKTDRGVSFDVPDGEVYVNGGICPPCAEKRMDRRMPKLANNIVESSRKLRGASRVDGNEEWVEALRSYLRAACDFYDIWNKNGHSPGVMRALWYAVDALSQAEYRLPDEDLDALGIDWKPIKGILDKYRFQLEITGV